MSRARPDGLSAQRGESRPTGTSPARADRGCKGIVGIDSNAEPGGSTAGAGDHLAPRERARLARSS